MKEAAKVAKEAGGGERTAGCWVELYFLKPLERCLLKSLKGILRRILQNARPPVSISSLSFSKASSAIGGEDWAALILSSVRSEMLKRFCLDDDDERRSNRDMLDPFSLSIQSRDKASGRERRDEGGGGGGEEIKRVKEIKGEGRKAQRGEKESQSGE